MKETKILGAATFLVYLVSFFLLFSFNTNAWQELDSLSLTGYNIEGVPGQLRIRLLNYLLPGLLMALFGLSLSRRFKPQSQGKIGSLMFLLSGISWMSFAFNPVIANSLDNGMYVLREVKAFIACLFGIIALILTSTEINQVVRGSFFKWVGMMIAILVILELTYYWFFGHSGIISSISWTIYFGWFALFAIQKSHQSTTCILNPS